MKVALLGARCSPSAAPMDHTVVPFVGLPDASAHVNAVPPHSWTSIPRCCLYQARSATGSFALKKIPPIPVTFFISASEVQPKLERTAFATPNAPAHLRRANVPGVSFPHSTPAGRRSGLLCDVADCGLTVYTNTRIL